MVYRQINTRSPFYVQLVTAQPIVQLELRIWLGDVTTDRPTNATHILDKEAANGAATFEMAELVRDYISQSSSYSDGAVWVETELYDFSNTPTIATYLATEGYNTSREDMSHSGNTFTNDYVMLPKDTDLNYRITGAKGEISKFQVLVNAVNDTDWSYTTYDTQGNNSALKSSNLINFSENFKQWNTNGYSTLTKGITDANGGADAYEFEATSTGTFLDTPAGISEVGTHIQSIYVKYSGADAEVEFNNSEFSTGNVFNITSSEVTAQTPSADRSVESVGNGWYRISIRFTVAGVGVTPYSLVPYIAPSSVILLIEEPLEALYVFGAQLEAQESTTAYIKTEGFIIEGTQTPSGDILTSSASDGLIRTFKLDDNVGRVELNLNGVIKTVYHDVFDCNKYNNEEALTIGLYATYAKTSRPVMLSYVNKHGAKNTFAFTLKHSQEMQSTSSNYTRNVTDYTNLNRNKNLHSIRKVIGNTKQTFTINTDYISEYYVEQIEELVLSEYVWALNPLIDDEYVPVMITDTKVLKKNHLNDRLIQYTISYEMASNYINTIR
jgi:hypothetical protein